MKKRDIWTLDMFAEIPPVPVTEAGGLSCREEISRAMSHAMRGLNRETIAADMSALLGWKSVKASVLNMYAAPSATLYFNWDGVRHKVLGARGNCEWRLTASGIPYIHVTAEGLVGAIGVRRSAALRI